jgi:mono/diheme cytochrome c family protein
MTATSAKCVPCVEHERERDRSDPFTGNPTVGRRLAAVFKCCARTGDGRGIALGAVMSRRAIRSCLTLASLVLMTAAGGSMSAQTPSRPPRLGLSSVYGPDLFRFYCASCHGPDGRGGGPAASALKLRVPDLTMMSSRERGVFPKARVTAIVSGDQTPAIPSHGSREMPVWGPIFRALDPGDPLNKARIENIVAHLESLQVRTP